MSSNSQELRTFLSIHKTVSFSLVLATALSAATRAAHAQNNYFAGDGTAINTAKYASSASGPFTNSFTSGSVLMLGTTTASTSPATGIGATITVSGITATDNFNLTPGGTLGTGGTVAPIVVSAGKTLNIGSQLLSTASGTGFTYNGNSTGTLVIANGNAYNGGFTLTSGTIVVGGVNALGNGGALNINGGTIAGSASRDFTGRYTGITIGGDFTLGSTTSPASSTANLTYSAPVFLGSTLRTINTAGTGTNTFSGVVSGTGGFAVAAGSTGVLALTGTNTYTGGTAINGGTVVASGTGLGNNSAVSVASGAILSVGKALNTKLSSQTTGTLSALSLAVTSTDATNTTPALTFNLGASGTNDMLTLTGTAPALNFSGSGTFNIGFASATGASLSAGTYTLISLTNAESTANAPAITNYNAIASGNLARINNGSFAYTYDTNNNITGLTYTIGGSADALPEPTSFALIGLGALAFGGQVARRRHTAWANVLNVSSF